jgi:hypothetical protein
MDARLKNIYEYTIQVNSYVKNVIPKYAFILALDSHGLPTKLGLEDGNNSTQNTYVSRLDMSQNGF